MAKRVDPLLSVTGNFGRYGGAHNVRATAIGATSRGPHNTLYFRGVIRATEDNKQALREKSDEKSEVTRRMSHGAQAYIDPRGRTVLPRHPHTRRAPIVLREADGNPTNPGWHFMNRGGDMPDRGAPPGGAPPGGGGPGGGVGGDEGGVTGEGGDSRGEDAKGSGRGVRTCNITREAQGRPSDQHRQTRVSEDCTGDNGRRG